MTQADLDIMQAIFMAGFRAERSRTREATTEFLGVFCGEMSKHDSGFDHKKFCEPFWKMEE